MTEQSPPPSINLLALAGELGFLIAVPLVVLVVVGVKIDEWLHTKPLFIIGGMLVAGVITSVAVFRKIKKLNL